MANYKIHYRDNFDGSYRLPDQQITDPSSLETSFSVLADETARSWISDNKGSKDKNYEIDDNYQIVPEI